MKILTIDKLKCTGRNSCANAQPHILDAVGLDGCIKLTEGGWADNLENNNLFSKLVDRCPCGAIKVTK